MTEGLEAVTAAALSLALDAASLRQQAHALNIANASTEGYTPVRVSFEAQLEAARADLRVGGALGSDSLEDVAPALEPVTPGPGGMPAKVQLDLEVAAMSHNAGHYHALLRAVSKHYSVLASAVRDGKK
jgi:flagellar basal-body rod protein FlgB